MTDTTTSSHPDEPQSPGRLLAAARQARGMTVTEVALRLKFSPRQIEALEADHYDVLRGPSMVRGMIRGYAKLIGLDPQPVLDALHQRLNAGPMTMQPRAMAVPFPRATPKGSLVYVLLSAVVVIAVVSVIVEWVLRPGAPPAVSAGPRLAPAAQGGAAPSPAAEPAPVATPAPAVPQAPVATQAPAAAPSPVPTSTPASTPAPAVERRPAPVLQHETVLHAKRIELVFDRESWVEIKDADGRIVFSQLNPPGSRRKVVGEAPFSIVIGNATGVKLRYNDSDVDLAPFTRTDVARLTLE
ncbi:MAG TPA: helix-turn-helix domain-containing protein [Burkholderiales bacterium]|nr:helix-turn-helix domain-containing protein [Burkholderiales bacterium]